MTDQDAVTVDARGHRCPVPTLRLRRAMEAGGPAARVLLLADDPMAKIDVPHMIATKGWRLVHSGQDGATLRFLVEA